MRRTLVALLLAAPAAALAQDQQSGPDCFSVRECVDILRSYEIDSPPPTNARRSSGINPRPIQHAIDRLRGFGDEAVVALLPLLDDENYSVQNRVSFTLFHFETIDARHAARLIDAHRRGLGWLVQPIARKGTDEALDYLWTDFLSDPNFASNSQMLYALPRFGAGLFPRLSKTLSQCRFTDESDVCSGVIQLLAQYDPFPAFALPLVQEIAASPDASEAAKRSALDQLIRQGHPYGLEVLRQSLEARLSDLPPLTPGPILTTTYRGGLYDLDIAITIDRVGSYGESGLSAGPVIERFLVRRDLPEARQAAALAIGRIGYSAGADALIAAGPDFSDDWYLAYNAAESLGRLRVQQAAPLLQSLARSHWYQPVRNNTARALNALAGGAFERPHVANDAAEPDGELVEGLGSEFRYQGDRAPPRSCILADSVGYSQYMPRDVRWPRPGSSIELEPRALTATQRRHFLQETPTFEPDGEVTFIVSMGGLLIVGTNAGEWGGGVHEIDRTGRVHTLVADNAIAAFKSGTRLFVVTGLSHLFMSTGNLWIIDLQDGRAHVGRRIQLPSEPNTFEITFPETLVISTQRGALAVQSDGVLRHPQEISACG